jgi:zinc protease
MQKKFLVIIMMLSLAQIGVAQKKSKNEAPVAPVATVAQVATLQVPVKTTSVEGITEYVLANGMKVLLFPDQTKSTTTVNITYLVGSKHENYGETGMAHLLEHLVFKGTPKHPDIPKELTEHGARPNGTTWTDRTNYYETFSASDENLKWALDLESDRMVNSYIAKKDLDSEMTVVRNEFESGENNPWRVLWQRMMSAAFDWHNYGKSTIGARADIENVPIDRLQAFYKKYYQPDNAVLVVAGKFDEAQTLKLVNDYFGPIPRPDRVLPQHYTRDPQQDGERTVTVKRVGDTQWVGAGYKTAASSHEDAAALEILSDVLGNDPSGRLYKALVDTKLATTTFTFNFQWKEPGILLAFAEVPKDKSIEAAKAAMVKAIDNTMVELPTAEEIERAKNSLIKGIELSFNSSERIALQLSEYIGSGDWRLFFIMRDRIKAATAEDVARVAKNYLKPDNRTIGQFIPTEKPERTEIPEEVDVMALVKDYKGNALIAAGEVFDPSPANIESRTAEYTLANGMKVALLSKKTRGESVQLRMTLRYGDAQNLAGKGTIGSITASMLDKGTSKLSRKDIQDAFDKLKANVRIGGGATALSVSVETTRENLQAVLDLLAQVLKDPIFPQDEFDKLILQEVTGIESQLSEPTSIAVNRISKYLTPYEKTDPRYAMTFEESIAALKAVKLADVKSFYSNIYGTDGATVGVVGDFDDEAILAKLKMQYGEWKSKANYERLAGKVKATTALNENILTPDKANAFFLGIQEFEMNDQHPDYPALVMGNFMLGGGFLNSRLATRIRQKEGLSYGVGSNFNASSMDMDASFTFYAIYAPENVEKLEAAFNEEITKVVTEGFTDEEVAAAKSGWLQSRTVSRAQDASLAGTLNGYQFLQRSIMWDQTLEDKINAMTAEVINAAMKRHLDLSKISIVKAGDFNKGKDK